jgi:hypothetical protein
MIKIDQVRCSSGIAEKPVPPAVSGSAFTVSWKEME